MLADSRVLALSRVLAVGRVLALSRVLADSRGSVGPGPVLAVSWGFVFLRDVVFLRLWRTLLLPALLRSLCEIQFLILVSFHKLCEVSKTSSLIP